MTDFLEMIANMRGYYAYHPRAKWFQCLAIGFVPFLLYIAVRFFLPRFLVGWTLWPCMLWFLAWVVFAATIKNNEQ
jgi:small-conductance mechanosensitive channel